MGNFYQREEYKENFQNNIQVVLADMKIDDEQIEMMCNVFDRVENCVTESIDLSRNLITFKGMAYLSESVAMSSTIHTIILNSNHIGDAGFKYLGDSIATNGDLHHVYCNNNAITSNGLKQFLSNAQQNVTEIGILSLGLGINNIKDDGLLSLIGSSMFNHLEFLDLGCNGIGESGAVALYEACRSPENNLVELRFNFNDYGRIESATSLGNMLKENTKLSILNINSVLFSQDGFSAISEGLSVNTTLKHLSMSNSGLHSDAALELSDGLRTNTTIEEISIALNPIKNEGLGFVLPALKNNNELRKLDLSYCDLTNEAIDLLLNFINERENKEIVLYIDLQGNDFDEEGEKTLQTASEESVVIVL
eukprot:TRINITY_DN9796_c0_g1_i1.p1 TRINITY_DN9796_c0_g1~~TRINITY_DN9796_c0_g1_i1.p1  ORF type:complete len:365 (+),score=90.02 TRINITY_DN9796_c0_g1_i1:41-1135(+)